MRSPFYFYNKGYDYSPHYANRSYKCYCTDTEKETEKGYQKYRQQRYKQNDYYGKQKYRFKQNRPQCQPDLQKLKTPIELSKLSPYQLAKYYENNISARDMNKALDYYYKALNSGEKKDSCIKDLAGVLHQLGRTEEAITFLETQKCHYRGNMHKYENLIDNFKKQIEVQSNKVINKLILITYMPRESKESDFRSLFGNTSRIVSVKIYKDLSFTTPADDNDPPFGLIEFASWSSAKKTLASFKFKQNPWLELYWVNINYLLICQIKEGEDDPMALNTCYFASNSGFDRCFNLVDNPPPPFEQEFLENNLYTQNDFKKSDLRKIWKDNPLNTPCHGTDAISKRVGYENQIKLELIRKKKHTLKNRQILKDQNHDYGTI